MAIGETFLGAVLAVVFDRLASQEVINFFRSVKFDESLVNKLKGLMLATEKLLLDAEEKQMTDPIVKHWVDELKHWFYCAEEVVNEIATEALKMSLEKDLPPQPESLGTKLRNLIPAFRNSSLFSKTITPKIREVVEMLETMLSQKDALGLREISAGRAIRAQRVPSTYLLEDSKIYGRDEMKNKILEFLLSKEPERDRIDDVVAIVGMGGIGKTTLAKLVFNDGRLEIAFDIKVWVCVSDQFDISRVTRSILESVTHESHSESHDLNFLQTELNAKLKDKRFLLVLDDVWNDKYEAWECLWAPFTVGAYGSKIIVTTRNDEVASIMSTACVFRLKPLSNADAWSLFSRHAFEVGNLISNPCLEDIGKNIVRKCQGLPLAIKTLGRLLRSMHEIREWEAILQSSLWDLPCHKSNVIPALWLSYYYLPSHLKCCFSYCAVFPEGYRIERKQLVLLWMAENFVFPDKNERPIEDVGDDYLRQLLSRSFLEPMDESFVAMHDLMHDLAQVLSGDFLLRNELGTQAKFSKRARHFSYAAGVLDGITKFPAIHESTHLRTFLGLHNTQFDCQYLTNKIPTTIIPHLSHLRVLALSRYENLKLPESIGCLKQLCYLDVSCTKITQLPESVSTLYNLQTLLLSDCNCLERLPEEFGNLALLRHLDISGTTSLLHMPKQMSKLKSLQTLTDFVVGKTGGSGIKELLELQQIRGRFALRRLQNVAASNCGFDANLSMRKSIDDLALEFDYEDNDNSEKARQLLGNLKPHRNLKRLTIRNYAGTRFPRWLDNECAIYANLTYLCISGCLYCLSLPPLGQLPSIKELVLEGMEYIVTVGHEFYGRNNSGVRGPFPALESLRFEKMNAWEVWSSVDVEGSVVCFPSLKKLRLHNCPKLKGNLPVHVPSLEYVEIEGCRGLGGLLPRVPSIHPLEVKACPHAKFASALDVRSITTLRLKGLMQLMNLPTELEGLLQLRELEIASCDNLESLANVKLPLYLASLNIDRCGVLQCLPKGISFLRRLWRIGLDMCPYLTWTRGDSLPTSLIDLQISCCERLEFPIPEDRMQHYTSLTTLDFHGAGSHLVSFPLGIFPNLRFLTLRDFKGLEKVYIPEGAVNSNSLASLSSLFFVRCQKLKMIGKKSGRSGATVLHAPNLAYFGVLFCGKVRPVVVEIEGEVLLPKLKYLAFGNSWKIMSGLDLDLRRSLPRFSCLERLAINAMQVECFPDEDWGTLPTSVRVLYILHFPELRKLDGKALQNLRNLQKLYLWGCPKLECLPEDGLPPSLGRLDVRRCPMLEERCHPETGVDWSKIHHLPRVSITDKEFLIPDPCRMARRQ